MTRFLHKLRLTLCIWGFHKKKLSWKGYRCDCCGKFVGGYKANDKKRS